MASGPHINMHIRQRDPQHWRSIPRELQVRHKIAGHTREWRTERDLTLRETVTSDATWQTLQKYEKSCGR